MAQKRHLGLRFKASKAQPPKQAQVLQGVELQLFQDKAIVAPIPTRVDRLDSQLKQVLLNEQLKPRDAAALAGSLWRSLSSAKQVRQRCGLSTLGRGPTVISATGHSVLPSRKQSTGYANACNGLA